MNDIVIINGNPRTESIADQLVTAYSDTLKAQGHSPITYTVRDLTFNQDLVDGNKTELSPIVKEIQQKMTEAKLLVIYMPIYWGTFPGKFKSLFDQLLWPGIAYSMRDKKYLLSGLWRGKKARLIYSLGGNYRDYCIVHSRTGVKTIRNSFRLTGIFSTKATALENFDNAKRQPIDFYMNKVVKAAKKDSKRLR